MAMTKKEAAYVKAQKAVVAAAKLSDKHMKKGVKYYKKYQRSIEKLRKVEGKMTREERVKAAQLVETV